MDVTKLSIKQPAVWPQSAVSLSKTSFFTNHTADFYNCQSNNQPCGLNQPRVYLRLLFSLITRLMDVTKLSIKQPAVWPQSAVSLSKTPFFTNHTADFYNCQSHNQPCGINQPWVFYPKLLFNNHTADWYNEQPVVWHQLADRTKTSFFTNHTADWYNYQSNNQPCCINWQIEPKLLFSLTTRLISTTANQTASRVASISREFI